MNFHAIDRAGWAREEYYQHYTRDVPCTYSVTAQLDVTNLLRGVRTAGMKLYPALIYMVARAVNARREFRMDVVDGVLGSYDSVDPSYTVFHAADQTFSSIWTEYTPDFRAFHARYLADLARWGDVCKLDAKPGGGRNFVNISSVPWLSFTGFNLNLNLKSDFDYLLPIFTFGKYAEEGERTHLPLAVQAHHAVADGFHTARLISDMQAWADAFAPEN